MCRESEGTDSREAVRRSLEITIRPLVFITVWISNGHVVNSLVRMFCPHKVDQQVPQDLSLTIASTVEQRDLHAPVGEVREHSLVERAVWNEDTDLRLFLSDGPGYG